MEEPKTARDDYKLLDWYSKSTISSAFRAEMTKALEEIDQLRADNSYLTDQMRDHSCVEEMDHLT